METRMKAPCSCCKSYQYLDRKIVVPTVKGYCCTTCKNWIKVPGQNIVITDLVTLSNFFEVQWPTTKRTIIGK